MQYTTRHEWYLREVREDESEKDEVLVKEEKEKLLPSDVTSTSSLFISLIAMIDKVWQHNGNSEFVTLIAYKESL